MKALYFTGDGYVLLYKRLNNGKFQWPRSEAELMKLDKQSFRWLMMGVVAVYLTVFDGSKAFSLVPLLVEIFCCAALWTLDRFVSPWVTAALSAHPKALLAVLSGLVVALAVYAVAAFNVTGGATLNPGETLERAVYLDAGTYTVSAVADGGAQVYVVCQNEKDLIMHTETILYTGAVQPASFTVPEGTQVVWFRFTVPEGGRVSAVSYSGTDSGSLKLGYKLLPGFIANRLQGLRANQNAVQRVEFWRDGVKLWQCHPIFGNGLGSVEMGLYSVASFFYESKYVHNHYVQCLADIGMEQQYLRHHWRAELYRSLRRSLLQQS